MVLNPKAFELLCFIFAASFVSASVYYFFHSFATGFAWALTSLVTFTFASALRSERLEQKVDVYSRPGARKAVKVILITFCVLSALSLILAMDEEDGLEPSSYWMTLISTLMGAKWSYLLYRVMQRFAEAEERHERSLLNPIGEIA